MRLRRKPSPNEAIAILKKGNRRFSLGNALHNNTGADRLELAGIEDQGDYAYATVITCSDSRVPVERIFDAGIMDIFVIRLIGNIFTDVTLGSAEYGVCQARTPVLLVLGHTQCKAIATAIAEVKGEGDFIPPNIAALTNRIKPIVNQVAENSFGVYDDRIFSEVIEENVRQVIAKILQKSPKVTELVNAGEIKAIGAVYDVETGLVDWLHDVF